MGFYTVPSTSGGGAPPAGPWTRVGTNVILTVIGDFVGIGVAVPTEKLQIAGNITPDVDSAGNVGTAALRFAEVNAVLGNFGDIHMRDDARNAHWILREETDRIVAVNKITGKRYAIALTPIEDEE